MFECHIQGLGACMLTGHPHRPEDSFFHLALEQLRRTSSCQITDSSYTMGGFPITHVPKHLAARCLAARPSIVVIQFASSDLVVPLRRKRKRAKRGIQTQPQVLSSEPPQLIHRLWWQVQGLVGDALQLKPITAPEVYLETMGRIAQNLLDHAIIPVVMSPFVFGGGRSDRMASECNARLLQSLGNLPQAVYVDAYSALAAHPRHQTLISDGTHLSLSGHRIVANTLFPRLKSLVEG